MTCGAFEFSRSGHHDSYACHFRQPLTPSGESSGSWDSLSPAPLAGAGFFLTVTPPFPASGRRSLEPASALREVPPRTQRQRLRLPVGSFRPFLPLSPGSLAWRTRADSFRSNPEVLSLLLPGARHSPASFRRLSPILFPSAPRGTVISLRPSSPYTRGLSLRAIPALFGRTLPSVVSWPHAPEEACGFSRVLRSC